MFAAYAGPRCCTRSALYPFGPPETTERSCTAAPLLNSQYSGHRPPSVTAFLEVPLAVSQLLSKSTPAAAPTVAVAGAVTGPRTVAPRVGLVDDALRGVVSAPGTVTLTGADTAVWPEASRAIAVSVWAPVRAVVVSHETEYGGPVRSVPRLTPSSLNWTPTTPTSSVAVAETVTMPATLVPAAGAVMATVGGVVSGSRPVSRCPGTLTRKASRRPRPILPVQVKYWPVTSRLPFGSFE